MYFGEYIRGLREKRGFQQAEAARMLGMTPAKLNDLEKGRRNFVREPPTRLLKRIAAVYDHPLASLMEHTEFFQYEKSIVLDLLSDVEPALAKLDTHVAEMSREAERYTPEMEASAKAAKALLDDLKTGVRVARVRLQRGARLSLAEIQTRDKKGK